MSQVQRTPRLVLPDSASWALCLFERAEGRLKPAMLLADQVSVAYRWQPRPGRRDIRPGIPGIHVDCNGDNIRLRWMCRCVRRCSPEWRKLGRMADECRGLGRS